MAARYRGLSCAAEALDAGAGGFVGDSRSSGVWFETQDTKKKFDLNNPFAPVKLTPDSVRTCPSRESRVESREWRVESRERTRPRVGTMDDSPDWNIGFVVVVVKRGW